MKRIFAIILLGLLAFGIWQKAHGQITNVNIGAFPNDGTGDPARTAFSKLNWNDTFLLNATKTNSTNISVLQNSLLVTSNYFATNISGGGGDLAARVTTNENNIEAHRITLNIQDSKLETHSYRLNDLQGQLYDLSLATTNNLSVHTINGLSLQTTNLTFSFSSGSLSAGVTNTATVPGVAPGDMIFCNNPFWVAPANSTITATASNTVEIVVKGSGSVGIPKSYTFKLFIVK